MTSKADKLFDQVKELLKQAHLDELPPKKLKCPLCKGTGIIYEACDMVEEGGYVELYDPSENDPIPCDLCETLDELYQRPLTDKPMELTREALEHTNKLKELCEELCDD